LCSFSFSYPDISSSARPFVLEYLKEKYGFDFVEQEASNKIVYPTNSGLAPKTSTGLSTSVQVLAYPKYDFTQASIPPSFTPEQRAAFQNFLNDSENPVSAHDITITYTEIVKGIAEENGWAYDDETIKINKDLERDEKMLPNLASPVTQDSQSDWSFLMKLSRVLDCKCWLEYKGQDHVLYFKDMRGMRDDSFVTVGASGLRVEEKRFTFFFPRRGQNEYVSDNGRYNPETSGIKLFSDPFVRREMGLKYNYRAGGGMVQLRDVTVIEDIGMMNAITPESSDSVGEDQGIEYRTIVTLPTPFIKYDPADVNARELLRSDQDIEVVNQDGETYVRVPEVNILRLGPKKDILVVANSTGAHQTFTEETDGALILARDYTVEINREAVKNMGDLEADEMARRIAENNAILGSEFIRYLNFIPLPLEKEVRQRPFDWRGVRISATIDGNVNVKSQRFYQVVGIVRHGSDVDNEPFYLRSMTHVWDVTNGFSTKLEFFK